MHTRHFTGYEIFNHEEGSLAFFEHYENVERWIYDNSKNPRGYKEYGLKLITSAETEISYVVEE